MVAAAAVLMLAACSSVPDDPTVPPTTPVVETPTPAPTEESTAPELPDDLPERLADLVSEPVYPDAAREFTADGAAAFVQYVMDAGTWVYVTGDAAYLMEVCSDSSGFCSTVAGHSDDFRDGTRVRFGGDQWLEVSAVDLFEVDGLAFVAGLYSRNAYVDLDDDGTVVAESDSTSYEVRFQLGYVDDAWVLEGAGNA